MIGGNTDRKHTCDKPKGRQMFESGRCTGSRTHVGGNNRQNDKCQNAKPRQPHE